MNLEYRHLLNKDFHPQSRVWIYQSNRIFSLGEALEIEEMLKEFVAQWQSHGSPVKGEAHLFFGQFIVMIADDTADTIGGCSTDTSVRFIKTIAEKFNVGLFDRTAMAFVVKDKIQILPLSQIDYGAANGFIDEQTLYFNNLVQTKKELENNWIIPAGESWLAGKIRKTSKVN